MCYGGYKSKFTDVTVLLFIQVIFSINIIFMVFYFSLQTIFLSLISESKYMLPTCMIPVYRCTLVAVFLS